MKAINPAFRLSMLAPVPYAWPLHSRRRALADQFARRGLRVRYVAPPTPRAMLRHWIAPWRERRAGKVELVWPLPAPPLHWQQRLRLVNAIAALQARRITPDSGGTPHIIVAATPLWTPVVAHAPCDLLIYDCLDDPLVHARASSSAIYRRWHEELCRRADVIVAVSAALAERLRETCERRVVVCGNGVDADAFGALSNRESPAPSARLYETCDPALRDWFAWWRAHPNQPVAGFVGSIDRWVDVELLAATARALPHVQFVVAGPERYRGLAAPLAGIQNVHRIGLVSYKAVPALIATFDVGLIPFRAGPIAAAADPLKVYEYAAAGKAVVCSVPLRLDDPDAPLVTAETPAAFASAVAAAAAAAAQSPNDSAAREQRIAFARRHTWAARAEQFLNLIAKERSRGVSPRNPAKP
jgi:glycosyltransferase involved in cell wall biosynthesis